MTNMSCDPSISRLGQLDAVQWCLPFTSNRHLNIFRHRNEYAQIEHDNPNLIWLYTLIIQDEVDLPQGEVISAMKQRLLQENFITPLSWRYIANGTADDFQVVLNSQDHGGEPQWRWHTLLAWLRVLSGLRLNSPLPEPIQQLFLHDGLVVNHHNDEILFRGAWMRFDTLRHILNEAEKQLAAGTLRQFAEIELVEVIAWLGVTNPDLDNNRTKNGWKYLAKKAAAWKADMVTKASYRDLIWDSALPQMKIGHWMIDPVTDAWSLHRLAISQRHCGDRYIAGCLDGKEHIFAIRNLEGHITATLRLTLDDGNWVIGDIKGFANSEVSEEIIKLGEEIACHYMDCRRRILCKG